MYKCLIKCVFLTCITLNFTLTGCSKLEISTPNYEAPTLTQVKENIKKATISNSLNEAEFYSLCNEYGIDADCVGNFIVIYQDISKETISKIKDRYNSIEIITVDYSNVEVVSDDISMKEAYSMLLNSDKEFIKYRGRLIPKELLNIVTVENNYEVAFISNTLELLSKRG